MIWSDTTTGKQRNNSCPCSQIPPQVHPRLNSPHRLFNPKLQNPCEYPRPSTPQPHPSRATSASPHVYPHRTAISAALARFPRRTRVPANTRPKPLHISASARPRKRNNAHMIKSSNCGTLVRYKDDVSAVKLLGAVAFQGGRMVVGDGGGYIEGFLDVGEGKFYEIDVEGIRRKEVLLIPLVYMER